MNESELRGLADRFGTPTYVFDERAFCARVRDVRALFGEGITTCFSIKANPFLIPAALSEGMQLEVCSPGELEICQARGVDSQRIVYSGVCKQETDVRAALNYGVSVFTAESPLQLELVNRIACEVGKRIPVLLRLSGGSQFGMTRADLTSCVEHRGALAGVELVGIHYFVGTQRKKIRRQRAELDMLVNLAEELEREQGWRPQRLEYGPGLAVPYFEGDDFSDTLAPAHELAGDLRQVAERFELTVEMGRFYAGTCGSYLTRVVDVKEGADQPYAFVDGGMNHVTYVGQTMGMKVPRIRNLDVSEEVPDGRQTGPWTLCGSLCTTNDVLVRELALPLALGDVLSFDNIGAYAVTEGVYLFLSRTMPRIVLVGDEGPVLVRDYVESWELNTPGA